jgi:dihydrolipoamide dehydrogenase
MLTKQEKISDRGQVEVNDHLQTNVPNIYAIMMWFVDNNTKRRRRDYGCRTNCWSKPHIDYNLIPGVFYTWPEVAAVGQTEEQLKEAGIAYKIR